jgi:glutathione S-transferase
MKLIGMLDSPYVRRVAIGLDLLGVPFEHESVSVFSTFERFRSINPVVKAPTLVCDDGGIVMDSSLILQFVEAAHSGGRSLWSQDERLRQLQFRTVSYAQATTDKVVQLVYETQLRPPTAQHEPWKMRVRGQFLAGFAALEQLFSTEPGLLAGAPHHATIAAAIAWQFTQSMIPAEVPAARYPQLATLSAQCEALPLFLRWPPDGPGVPTPAA